jgi:hypothetical protein
MGTQSLTPVAREEDYKSDPRWHLIERILATNPFQKSHNLHSLLTYLAEHSISDRTDVLTERHIGTAVFGKSTGYSPAEDSAVRVHMRQLRLRLHEYFALDGRGEPLAVDIPKGSYVLEFHVTQTFPSSLEPVQAALPAIPVSEVAPNKRWLRAALFWMAWAAAVICAAGWYRATRSGAGTDLSWPLSLVIQPGIQTTVVVSDANASSLRFLSSQEVSLDQYLQPDFRQNLIPAQADPKLARVLNYIGESQLTSFADLAVTSTLIKLAGRSEDQLVLRSARDLDRRDLSHGDYIFVGSQISNPWVSLFVNKLNFEVVEDGVGGKMYFRNKKPLPGEQPAYEGLARTGSSGDDYATIALLPSITGSGNVLIFQGLRQEGTEALAELLSVASERAQLRHELGIDGNSHKSPYFEALVRVQAVAGAPVSMNIVATRNLSR